MYSLEVILLSFQSHLISFHLVLRGSMGHNEYTNQKDQQKMYLFFLYQIKYKVQDTIQSIQSIPLTL